MACMVFDRPIGCLRVKLIFSRENYDTHSNERKSDVSERILMTKKLTRPCIVLFSVLLQPSGGASVDECVFKTRFLMKPFITLFLRLCNLPTFELVGMCSYAQERDRRGGKT